MSEFDPDLLLIESLDAVPRHVSEYLLLGIARAVGGDPFVTIICDALRALDKMVG
jgi:hypothetical protein